MSNRDQEFSQLARDRKTAKILARDGAEVVYSEEVTNQSNQQVLAAIADAGFAPFHYARGTDGLVEPWRFHILWQNECRLIGRQLADWYPDMKPSNKLPPMLAACGCLVLVNWLPQFQSEESEAAGESAEKKLQVYEEHLAATAAATQNLLLSLAAKGMPTYWSSGGFFRQHSMFERLQIPTSERLLAAIFVSYGIDDSMEVIFGKNAPHRSDPNKWTREVSLDG